jgi:hypothetical protein
MKGGAAFSMDRERERPGTLHVTDSSIPKPARLRWDVVDNRACGRFSTTISTTISLDE